MKIIRNPINLPDQVSTILFDIDVLKLCRARNPN